MQHVDPNSAFEVVTNTAGVLAAFGVVPAAILAPVLILGRSIWNLFGKKKIVTTTPSSTEETL